MGARARTARSRGVEAVIDKDFASELLAREVDADLFVMATDVDGVYDGWGTPEQRRLDRGHARPSCAQLDFAAGSMGPKVEAAARFVEATGKRGRHRLARRHRADRGRHGRHRTWWPTVGDQRATWSGR